MAKSAAKKRPPARATATARTASKKSRTPAKKPAPARAVKAKLRPIAKSAKKVSTLKKAAVKPVARKAVKAPSKPKLPARSPAKPVSTKAIVKKAIPAKVAKAPAVSKPTAPLRAVAASPVVNGNGRNGSAKHVSPVATTVKSTLVKTPATKPPSAKFEPVIIPDSRVATNLKPRKNQVGLSVKELDYFRSLLLEKRREILGDMSSMESEALGSGGGGLSTLPVHMADMGTDNYEQEFTLGLVEKDRTLLREINNALAKIQNGTYGICEGTGNAIGKPRLEVQPWARYGIEYARLRERNGRGIR